MPGIAEITQLFDRLMGCEFADKAQYVVLPLHGALSTVEQKGVFFKPASGVTKIVIATNIAETSITIDDIVHVSPSASVAVVTDGTGHRYGPRKAKSIRPARLNGFLSRQMGARPYIGYWVSTLVTRCVQQVHSSARAVLAVASR